MGNCFSSQKQDLDKVKVEHVEENPILPLPLQQTPPGKHQNCTQCFHLIDAFKPN